MPRYRHALPQLGDAIFMSDGGMETDLIFNHGIELPCFATFDLLKSKDGRIAMRRYYEQYIDIARRHGFGYILEGITWRANPDWGTKLGYDLDGLAAANRDAISFLCDIRDAANTEKPLVVSCCLGPRGDGYEPGAAMTTQEAEAYHRFQTDIFASTDADMITAMTINNVHEAIGITRAAAASKMPIVISFTVETDGHLPTGQPLGEAIMEVDADSEIAPAYYMINCAHPTHFTQVIEEGDDWLSRLKGVRSNASKCSHAELDEATTLDDGDPVAFGLESAALHDLAPSITILGGCCGTDHRHVEEIAKAMDSA